MLQSSINVTNQRAPPIVKTLDGPYTSECTTMKGNGFLFKDNGKVVRWLFESSQTSHLKLQTLNFRNKLGNNFFK